MSKAFVALDKRGRTDHVGVQPGSKLSFILVKHKKALFWE